MKSRKNQESFWRFFPIPGHEPRPKPMKLPGIFRHVLASVWVLLSASVFADLKTEANSEPEPGGSNLPVIVLESKEGIFSDRKSPGTFKLVPVGEDPASVKERSAQLRIHGGVSRGYPKKSMGLTLDEPVRWLGMRKSAHWVLNAAFVDRSLMRHKLSYDLFRSLSGPAGKRAAAESRFVEVRYNGKYQGVYLLMERIDRSLLDLGKTATPGNAPCCIYKAIDHTANFSSGGHDGYELREPENGGDEAWKPLDEFNEFVNGAKISEFNDPTNGIAARLDVDNAIDFYLLVLLTSNGDGITKNFILARDAVSTKASSPRFFFAPWDYDATFGREWEGSRVSAERWHSNHLFDRLLKNAAFRKKFLARWQQLRKRQFSVEAIHRMIDENVHTLNGAARRNSAQWKEFDGNFPDQLTFQEDVVEIKEWIGKRLKWLDAEIARRCGTDVSESQ
jgi:hypothetical protein